MNRQICPTCGCPMKLTREEVKEIFQMSASVDELAKAAHVSRQTIWRIKTRKTHKGVTGLLQSDSVDEQEPR